MSSVYITVRQKPATRQMTLDEFLSNSFREDDYIYHSNTNTRTYVVDRPGYRLLEKINVPAMIRELQTFNKETEHLRHVDRSELYHSFSIPKRSGGLRRIDAPNPELMNALRKLKTIFEHDFGILYHTSAFAYVHGRCTVDAVRRHQHNESKWFGKFDLSNFFGNTTLEFVMQQFSMIFPLSEIMKYPVGREALESAVELAFLNGGLPQGTPISPFISNTIMIPIDYTLSKTLREFEGQTFVYTRYADDFQISSRMDFDIRKIEKLLNETLSNFNAPFSINTTKTRYGSSAGRNWNLGVMLNKDNNITVGNKKKKQLQAMLYNYITDKRRGVEWKREDIQTMFGYYNYYRMVEKDTIDAIVAHMSSKLNVDILGVIKEDLK